MVNPETNVGTGTSTMATILSSVNGGGPCEENLAEIIPELYV